VILDCRCERRLPLTSFCQIDDGDRISGRDEFEKSALNILRRQVLHVAAALVAGATVSGATSACADTTLNIENDEALERALPSLSNWGRWGPDD
jgi:hypothetical protein